MLICGVLEKKDTGALSETDVQSTEWERITILHQPKYLFVPQETGYRAEYESGWEVN